MSKIKSIMLFGASDSGKDVYNKLKDCFNILGFYDNDTSKHGKEIYGKQVYSPIKIKEMNIDMIVITSHHWKDIYQQLSKDLKIDEKKIRIGYKLLTKADLESDIKILQVDDHTIESNRRGIYWLLGYACNYSCSYCFYRMKKGTINNVTEEHIVNAVNNIENTMSENLKIDLVGGEPTIFPYYKKLVWDIEKITNVERIQTETNLSKDINFFEDLFRNTKNINKLTFSASFHFDHAKLNEFIDKISFFSKNNIHLGVTLMAHPDRLEEVRQIVEKREMLSDSISYQLAVILDLGLPDPRYTKEDLQWIRDVNDSFINGKDNKTSGVAVKYSSQGKVNTTIMSPRRVLADGFNNFKGMKCRAGVDSVRINEYGDIFPAMCFWEKDKKELYNNKNIFTKNQQIFFEDPVDCSFSCCMVPSDIRINKYLEVNKEI